ncbi:U4/U6-U5 snRNP complex subunit [Saccharomycopsis crataegensis]|uniref:U4/U6-U5 snRNP complex subunit n=1 Tax=Saccharomycopsis crataegensis TaxID=43959 RepID=A0AAV5QF73_9ASCO|nr:U4/U6-U5 snRNP complex subunit [Saccharomycopsis crataegensis]
MSGKEEKEESLSSVNSYGRRTWNRDAYAKLAQQKKSRPVRPDETSKKDITQRKVNIDFDANINKVQLVDQSASVSIHKGKSSGFYCEICNLTFKDNLSFLNHINSPKHLENSEFKTRNLNKNITLEDIRKKLKSVHDAKLRQKENENDLEVFNLKRRIENRKIFEDHEAERKRQKKKEKKTRKYETKINEEKSNSVSATNNEMMEAMGFSSFGTSKK